jgi:hypothetical protein
MVMRAAKHMVRSGASADPISTYPSFWWGGAVALVAALLSAWAGEERMMDAFAVCARILGRMAGFRKKD